MGGYLNKIEWTLVGHIGVDAGLCWIGDPCYILHREYGLPESLGKNWGDFCDILGEEYPTVKSFGYGYDLLPEGLGVAVSTGFGDGSYPVYVRFQDEGKFGKRISAVFVDFFGDAFGDNEK